MFDYKLISYEKSEASDIFIKTYILTSQRWPINEYEDIPSAIWKHKLLIYLPKEVFFNQALLYVNAGYNMNKKGKEEFMTSKEKVDFIKIASTNKAVVIEVQDVPNQFLLMSDEPKKEDQILAYTYKKVMESPLENAYLAGHLPMVKAAIKAMDATQDILKKDHNIDIESFILAGASKRGWAVWLTALEDQRVSGIILIVIDILNVQKTISHICSVCKDGCPQALRDYKKSGITQRVNDTAFLELMKIEDPFSYLSTDYDPKYKQRLAISKYIINASGDDFFVPDSSRFYFKNLPGDKNYIRYLPNALHYMAGNPISDSTDNQHKVSEAINSYFYLILNNISLPMVNWTFSENTIKVITTTKPHTIKLWNAINENSRDFRFLNSYEYWHLLLKKLSSYFFKEICDTCYTAKEIPFSCENGHECEIEVLLPQPEGGWQASFVELHYSLQGMEFVITTEVLVLPDTYPD